MNKYLLESLENGSHGIIPTEDLNYFVGNKRITVYKDGKKIIDKEVQIDDDGNICKYNIICDDDKDPELVPATDVEEYNVANMLPQVYPEGSVLRKEEEEDFIDATDEVVTESVAGALLIGGTVALTGGLIAYEAKKIHDEKKALDWYAEEKDVKPRFSDLTRKNYKVKYTHRTHDIDATDKEKLFNIDKSNVAEVYSYNGEKAFCILYGNKIDWVESLSATAIANIILTALGSDSTSVSISSYSTIKVILYDQKFKKELYYYAGKAMIKHSTSLASVDKWTKEITKKYKESKKLEKLRKESEFDFSNDLDAVLETCDNILTKIESYKTINESEDISDEEVITESADSVIEESVKDKVKEVTDLTKSELEKIKELASEKIDITKALKKEVNSLKKSDLKRKLIKNQKDIRKLVKGYKPDTRKKVTKAFGSINPSTIHDMNLQLFMDQVRRDNETAMRAHQTAMDMHNQAVMQNQHMVNQQMMMNSMNMGMM